MEKNFARFISIVFHPLLHPLYGLVFLFHSGFYISYLPAVSKQWIYLIVIANTILIPLSFFPFYLYKGIIHSIQMETKKERLIPLAVQLGLFYIAYFLFKKFQVPLLLRNYILAGILTNFVILLFSFKIKISIHLTSLGALTGIILSLCLKYPAPVIYLMFLFLISGFTAFARLKLQAHNPFQVYLGYVTGLLTSGLLFYFLLP